MKRILIVSHAMGLGGAERSLLGLLGALDPGRCETDLFLLRHEGELMGYIPEHVRLLPPSPQYGVLARPMRDTLAEGHLLLTAARLEGKLRAAAFDRRMGYTESGAALEYSHKYTCRFMPDIQPETEYDLAISYLTPHYFTARKVRAKKKIAWIHTDYSFVQVDVPSELAMWSQYDRIVSISDSVSEGFVKTFPQLEDKLLPMQNILPRELILRQAEEGDVSSEMPEDGAVRLLSIGRFCYQKNFDSIPAICAKLLERGLNVRWYIIGFGGDEELIRRSIVEANMEGRVVLLGRRENPYPYIKACDVYVQPSRYEGKAVTVQEAQMHAKPVVITDYPTSGSQLEDGVDGVIVPMESEACAEGIAALLRSPERQESLRIACRSRDYSGADGIRTIYDLL